MIVMIVELELELECAAASTGLRECGVIGGEGN